MSGMDEYPNTARGDVQAWGLTHGQAANYHSRIATYWANRSVHHATLAVYYANRSVQSAKVAAALAVLALILLAASALAGW